MGGLFLGGESLPVWMCAQSHNASPRWQKYEGKQEQVSDSFCFQFVNHNISRPIVFGNHHVRQKAVQTVGLCSWASFTCGRISPLSEKNRGHDLAWMTCFRGKTRTGTMLCIFTPLIFSVDDSITLWILAFANEININLPDAVSQLSKWVVGGAAFSCSQPVLHLSILSCIFGPWFVLKSPRQPPSG